MDQRIVQFIQALRTAGVRISLAESADAFRAVDHLGVYDRETFRISLRSTLVKESRDFAAFEELFPVFFGSAEPPPLTDLSKDLTPEEARAIAEALRQFNQSLQRMLNKLLRGENLTQQELDRLGQLIGLNQIGDMRLRNWMAQRMQKALNFREVREALAELQELLEKLGVDPRRAEQIRQIFQANQQFMSEQIDHYVGQKIAENMSQRPPEERRDQLFDRAFDSLTDRELEELRKEVQRLAAALRTRVALRLKRARNGQLDVKATLRANLKHGNVPIEIRHRDRTLKPKIVAICDISTSMRSCSELMLSLLYALQDQISKTHAFAFIDHLEYISPEFQRRDSRQAVQHVLRKMPSGHYNTDFGYSLANFFQDYMDKIDHKTTLIVVGDGRNNYNDPRLDLFQMLARRARRTIWLNPEHPALWGMGDSDMLKYAPACDVVLKVSNFGELVRAFDQLLLQG